MKWMDLLVLLDGHELFEASMLLAGPDSPSEVRRQLSRWTASGRLIQLRRGLYVLAPPFARTPPGALAIAARIRKPSYVSLQSALAYHGVIPESVPAVTSVTTGRPGRVENPLGTFLYRHVGPGLFWGYREVQAGGANAYLADAEKALLDLFHLTPGEIPPSFIEELRLSSHDIDVQRLGQYAQRTAKPKLIRAAALTARLLEEDEREEEVV